MGSAEVHQTGGNPEVFLDTRGWGGVGSSSAAGGSVRGGIREEGDLVTPVRNTPACILGPSNPTSGN